MPCKEANVNSCAKAGTLETLNFVIVKFELEISFEIIDSYSNFPSSKPSIKSNLKGFFVFIDLINGHFNYFIFRKISL